MIEKPTIRAYITKDKEAVVGLLKLNTPKYFAQSEEEDFIYYLENELEQYFVLEYKNKIVGCGGINFSNDSETAKISWDIFHPNYQEKGFGRLLVKHRIEILLQLKNVKTIAVRTSQYAYLFYEKQGFRTIDIIKNYWANSFDLYHMEYFIS